MIIGIDASRSAKEKATGVENYSHHIIKAILKQKDPQNSYRFYTPQWIPFLKKEEQRLLVFPRLWTLIRLSLEMLFHPPDVLFVPSHILPFFTPAKSYTMIHDLAFLKEPRLYSFFQRLLLRWGLRRALKKAHKILVPSQAVQEDFKHFFPKATSKVLVFHHGLSPLVKLDQKREREILQDCQVESGSFFLFVGRLEKKKNILGLLKAWELFYAKNPGMKLLLAGNPAHGYEAIEEAWLKHPFQESILIKGYIEEEVFSTLLSHAKAFVFPSFEEGFGLPLLQSFSKNCPVLCSNIPSLKEVGGEAALYFSPEKPEEIAEKMQLILQDSVREAQSKAGEKRVQHFTWEASGEKLVKLLESS